MVRYLAPDSEGLLAALVIDGVGVQVTVTGPEAEANQSLGEDIATMLVSIGHGESP